MQEAARKDVERVFGVLEARFAIVAQPAQGWSHRNLQKIMKCCVILHNMIIENERGSDQEFFYESTSAIVTTPEPQRSFNYSQFFSNYQQVTNSNLHYQLQNDLFQHLWSLKGQNEE
jgi:hypothetical protein